jgi:biopolymer transport protein TolR
MAFGRLERTRGESPMSDINMTPLIDVMLVLVVIFLITAPLLASSVRLDLPRTDAAGASDAPQSVLVVIDRSGQVFVDDKPVTSAELATRLTRVAVQDPATEVQLRADRAVAYGRVVEVIGMAQKAGLGRIGFMADSRAETP